MHKQLAIVRKYRAQLAELTGTLNLDQLNKIPEGYNNNIIWHLGHLVVTLPGMSYRRAGLTYPLEEELWQAYKPGSFPAGTVDGSAIQMIGALLSTSLDTFEADLAAGRFTTYTPWVTRTGVAIDSLDDALAMITFHEGLHAGYVAAMKKLV